MAEHEFHALIRRLFPRDWMKVLREIGMRRRSHGCDCTRLCEMGPTCPGAILADLPGSGCHRTARKDDR